MDSDKIFARIYQSPLTPALYEKVPRVGISLFHISVNINPKATMPESSSTWDVSFSASGNTDKEFGFEIGTGYSSTIKGNK